MTEDRSIFVQPGQYVRTAWIGIDQCRLQCRERMDFAAIERAGRRYLQAGECQLWPPVVGHWEGERFVVCDGRHEYLALLALGREKLFVGWLADIMVADESDAPAVHQRSPADHSRVRHRGVAAE